MIFFLILVVLVFVAQIAEMFIPPLDWMFNAHVYIVPVIVFCGAMALPFPLMLCLAFVAGFLWDAMTVQVLDANVIAAFQGNTTFVRITRFLSWTLAADDAVAYTGISELAGSPS